jgi:hypothetical protein
MQMWFFTDSLCVIAMPWCWLSFGFFLVEVCVFGCGILFGCDFVLLFFLVVDNLVLVSALSLALIVWI